MVELLESARRAAAQAANAVLTAAYWEMGRRVIEFEQGGSERATYGEGLLKRLSRDLVLRFGRGFSLTNFKQFREFYLLYSDVEGKRLLSGRSWQGHRCKKVRQRLTY